MISPELARIVAHIAADGYSCVYQQKRSEKELISHPRKKKTQTKWYVRYVNTEPALVKQFVNDAKKEFDRVVVKKKVCEYEIAGKWIYEIVTKLGALKSFTWFIPEEVTSAGSEVRTAWLQAFFDDEAHVSVPEKRITLNMVNENGLKQVQKLLSEFGIKSTLNGPYKCRQFFTYHLRIYRDSIRNYAMMVGFVHPKKKRHLTEVVEKISGSAGI
jgi:intein/homing endonuclease